MKFLSAIIGTEKDRAEKKRRNLEISLHKLEEKIFLLEMELEEARRQREKVIKELRNGQPTNNISTVSISSGEMEFQIPEQYCGPSEGQNCEAKY